MRQQSRMNTRLVETLQRQLESLESKQEELQCNLAFRGTVSNLTNDSGHCTAKIVGDPRLLQRLNAAGDLKFEHRSGMVSPSVNLDKSQQHETLDNLILFLFVVAILCFNLGRIRAGQRWIYTHWCRRLH